MHEKHQFPELGMYDEERKLDLFQDDCDPFDSTVYKVVFEVAGEQFTCRLHGCDSEDEALGFFFRDHPNISYSMVQQDKNNKEDE